MSRQRVAPPARDTEVVEHFCLDHLYPGPHIFALHLRLRTLSHLYCDEESPHPQLLGSSQFTDREMDVFMPFRQFSGGSSQYIPYAVFFAAFEWGYAALSDARIDQAQQRLEEAAQEELWDTHLRPIRNIMGRLRVRLREVGLDTVSLLNTGYLLIKNPRW